MQTAPHVNGISIIKRVRNIRTLPHFNFSAIPAQTPPKILLSERDNITTKIF